jgi:hypothetical protein
MMLSPRCLIFGKSIIKKTMTDQFRRETKNTMVRGMKEPRFWFTTLSSIIIIIIIIINYSILFL